MPPRLRAMLRPPPVASPVGHAFRCIYDTATASVYGIPDATRSARSSVLAEAGSCAPISCLSRAASSCCASTRPSTSTAAEADTLTRILGVEVQTVEAGALELQRADDRGTIHATPLRCTASRSHPPSAAAFTRSRAAGFCVERRVAIPAFPAAAARRPCWWCRPRPARRQRRAAHVRRTTRRCTPSRSATTAGARPRSWPRRRSLGDLEQLPLSRHAARRCHMFADVQRLVSTSRPTSGRATSSATGVTRASSRRRPLRDGHPQQRTLRFRWYVLLAVGYGRTPGLRRPLPALARLRGQAMKPITDGWRARSAPCVRYSGKSATTDGLGVSLGEDLGGLVPGALRRLRSSRCSATASS